MKILAIDTSTEACSAAITLNDTLFERFEIAPQRHTDLILPMIEAVMQEAGISDVSELDALALGRGPGSFTGIRIGTGVAQGISLGSGLEVAPVSTLAALAQQAYRLIGKEQVIAAIDARMGEVYWGAYELDDAGFMQACQAEMVAKPENLVIPEHSDQWFGVGSAWGAYESALTDVCEGKVQAHQADYLPHAQDIAYLAMDIINKKQCVSAENIQPVYLRNEVAWKKTSPQAKS